MFSQFIKSTKQSITSISITSATNAIAGIPIILSRNFSKLFTGRQRALAQECIPNQGTRLTAYNIFYKKAYADAIAKGGHGSATTAPMTQLAKDIAAAWRALPASERQIYQSQADQNNSRLLDGLSKLPDRCLMLHRLLTQRSSSPKNLRQLLKQQRQSSPAMAEVLDRLEQCPTKSGHQLFIKEHFAQVRKANASLGKKMDMESTRAEMAKANAAYRQLSEADKKAWNQRALAEYQSFKTDFQRLLQ